MPKPDIGKLSFLIRPFQFDSSRLSHLLHRNHIHDFHKPRVYDHNLKLRNLIRSGKIEVARQMFDHLPERDVVTWNTMLAAYWEGNDVEECERIFGSMPERSVVSWNCMVSGYVEHGNIDEAFRYFLVMPERSIASWNAMISGLVKYNCIEKAEKLFCEMPERNVISYTTMIDGLMQRGDIERAQDLFDKMPRKNDVSWAVMISGYVENSMIQEARVLFDYMPRKSVFAFTAMITGYCKEGDVDNARILFEALRHKDLIAWNVMLTGYAQHGHGEETLRLHKRMVTQNMKPDHTTLIVVLTACSVLTSLLYGKQTHAIAIKHRLETVTSLCNSFISMYSKCGSIKDSELIFRHVQYPDIVTWNAIVAVFAQHGLYEKALVMFHELHKTGLKPDGITFLSVLSACGHAGMVEESLYWFNLMVHEYEVHPGSEHFACLVDILGRAGMLEKAYRLIVTMPFEATCGVWGALLGACRVYLNVELGEMAARELLALDPQNSATYVILSNIYADAGMWAEVTRVRLLMKDRNVHKLRGYSWTEIGDQQHMFTGGDVCHPDIGIIHEVLKKISLHMRTSSYIKDTDVHTSRSACHNYGAILNSKMIN